MVQSESLSAFFKWYVKKSGDKESFLILTDGNITDDEYFVDQFWFHVTAKK